MSELLYAAKQGNYAVAAPNVFSDVTVRAVFEIADQLKAPIILNCVGAHGIENVAAITRFYAQKHPAVTYALNLDHGGDFEEIMLALRNGFSSVMIDRSQLCFDDNIREVKEVVKIAYAMNVSVEAELGHVGQGFEYEATRNAGLTNVDEAVVFVKETNVDCLAVAIGTSHGVYKGTPKLEFDLLQQLRNAIQIPLVLHGASGTGDDLLQKAVRLGIQKINLFTDLSNAGLKSELEYMGIDFDSFKKDGSLGEFGNKSLNMFDAAEAAAAGYQKALAHYMRLFGSENKA